MARVLKFHETTAEDFTFGEATEGTRYFEAIVDELKGAIAALRVHAPELQRFQPHPDLEGVYVDSFAPTLRRNTCVYDIEVRYTNRIDSGDPLDKEAVVNWSSKSEKIPVFRDDNGEPLLLTSGEAIQGVSEDRKLWVATVTKNLPRLPPWIKQYDNSVNSDRVLIDGEEFEPETLLIGDLQLGHAEQGDIKYRTLSLSITHNPDTWVRIFPNAGYYELLEREEWNELQKRNIPVLKLERICDHLGQPVTTPKFLNDEGRRPRDEQGNVREQLAPEDLLFLKKWTKKRLPFNALPLR